MRNLFFLAGMQDKRKSPPCQYGASPDSAPASARLSLRTEFARTLQKTVILAALAFFDLPFSGSYFERTSCPSTRTWSYEELAINGRLS